MASPRTARPGRRPRRAILDDGEVAVLERVRLGHTMEQVGRDLYLSAATVKDRLRVVYALFDLDYGPQDQLVAALRWEALRGDYHWRVAAFHEHVASPVHGALGYQPD